MCIRDSNSIVPDNIYYEIPKGKAPYFAEHVRRILAQQDEQLGINIYQDGLKIHTTLDYNLQKIAEDAVMQTLKKNQDVFNRQLIADKDKFSQLAYLSIFDADSVKMMLDGQVELYDELRKELLVQCAFIALDTKTGEILAMIGGRSDYPDEFNRSTQALRQPGSVFKPYIYTAAIDNNYPVTTQLLNQPVALYRNNSKGEREKWTPSNYDKSTGGLTTLREGLQRSLNLISVRMVQELVPPRQVKDIAQRMQITSPIRAVDSIALGTSEVKPIEIVASYATFANKGIYSTPIAITRIEDKYGRIIKEYSIDQKEVLSPETAFMVTNLLQSVVDKGTGGSLRWRYKFRHPAGGKTGTTQNLSDAWFVGFTPNITAGVWYGMDEYSVSLGDGQYGGVAALPAWALFMKNAHKELNIPKDKFEIPDGVVEVEIDSDTKQLPTSKTKNLETVEKIWEIMFSSNLNRSDEIVIIGGGVMLDLCSFAAITYKRGIAFTLVPSTLLAMVDASHGGKNGFNNNYGKNQIGTFNLPKGVVVCFELLNTLKDKDYKDGLIELVKHGLIGSKEIFDKLVSTENFKILQGDQLIIYHGRLLHHLQP